MLHHPEVKVEALLDAARARFSLPPDSPHSTGHWLRVLKYGRVFARDLQGDEALVIVAALSHDCCRSDDGFDPLHGHRAADWAAQHNGKLFAFDRQRMSTLRDMLRRHNDGGYVPTDPTAAAFTAADRADIDRDGVGLNVSSRFFTPKAWRVYVDKVMLLKKLTEVVTA
jgi:uncharacterized protein